VNGKATDLIAIEVEQVDDAPARSQRLHDSNIYFLHIIYIYYNIYRYTLLILLEIEGKGKEKEGKFRRDVVNDEQESDRRCRASDKPDRDYMRYN